MTLVAVLVLGVFALQRLPVSLMPEVKIPQVTVQVTAENMSAREIDATVVRPLRSQLTQLGHLKDIRTETRDGRGNIFMEFEHGSDMDFIFIEVNEKIDRANLPREINRPRTIKANATDIPAFYINLTMRDRPEGAEADENDFMALSKFAITVITKRIEQISEVAMVDISGQVLPELLVIPDQAKLRMLGIQPSDLETAIRSSHVNLGNLTIRDGEYQYNIRFSSTLKNREDVENVYCKVNGRLYQLKELASVREVPQSRVGEVWSDGKPALTMAVIKQADARMSDLRREINRLTEAFRTDYPDIDFTVTRDQTALLDYSISNLTWNLMLGIILACVVIFLFMHEFRSPLLVTITIPIALIVLMLCMYALGISINIISLSGIVLGVGMMVDNSIIVIDNITQHWDGGEPLSLAAARGTNEVFAPMLSSVLTTCAVFVPLIFMSGIAGALFYDQAMAVTVGLLSSLAVSILILPVYYFLIYKKQGRRLSGKRSAARVDYVGAYERGLKWLFRHQLAAWGIFVAMVLCSVLIYTVIEKRKLPPITQNDLLLNVEWNQRINEGENVRRCGELVAYAGDLLSQSTVMAGTQKFLLPHTAENSTTESTIYLKAVHPDSVPSLVGRIEAFMHARYPRAVYETGSSGNVFEMIFAEREPSLVARIRSVEGKSPNPDKLNGLLRDIRKRLPELYIEPVEWQEVVQLRTSPDLMALYGLDYATLFYRLKSAFNANPIFDLHEGEFSVPIVLGDEERTLRDILQSNSVRNKDGVDIPLNTLVRESRVNDLKNIISGPEGEYYPLRMEVADRDIKGVVDGISSLVAQNGEFEVSFSGSYYSSRELIGELAMILVVSLLLLYFILSAQFESLVQPFVILSEIAVDVFGALFLLWICGSSVNIMSLIGVVVMCGIVINDSILKVDTINRLRKSGYGLKRAIMMAGKRRLKPIVMTSLTTILAIVPFLFTGNLGSDLQFPLSLAIIGGMTVGTVVSVYFIPLAYYELYRRKERRLA